MSLVLFDIECVEVKIVKELGVFMVDLTWDTVSFHPKSTILLFEQSNQKFLHEEVNGSANSSFNLFLLD